MFVILKMSSAAFKRFFLRSIKEGLLEHPYDCACDKCMIFQLEHGDSCDCANCQLDKATKKVDEQLANLMKYGSPYAPVVPLVPKTNVIDLATFRKNKKETKK